MARATRYILSIPVPKELYDAVKEAARRDERTAAQWARYVLRREVQRRPEAR